MAAFVEQHHGAVRTAGRLDRLAALMAHELEPSSRRFWTSLRLTTIATVGAALIVICHVNNELGTYIVWLLVGAGPMMSVRKASGFLAAEAVVLAFSVVMARAFAETPWFMLPLVVAFMALSTFIGVTRQLGTAVLLIQVLSLGSFYGVVFAPREIGWAAAGAFGGSAIAFGVIVLFDNWLWPDRADPILMKTLERAQRTSVLAWSRLRNSISTIARSTGRPNRRRLPTCRTILRFSVVRSPKARRHAAMRCSLQPLRVWRASISKWTA